MITKEMVGIHLNMNKKQYKKLKEAREKTGKPMYIIVNFILLYISRLLKSNFDLKVRYEKYLQVGENTGKGNNYTKRPYVKLFKNIHFFVRNIKNRNFRSSIALLVRLGIDKVLSQVIEDILSGKLDESIFYTIESKIHKDKKDILLRFKVVVYNSLEKSYIHTFKKQKTKHKYKPSRRLL